jgi:hypothetical protein
MSSAAIERVWSRLPEGCRQALEDVLSPTDLQSLLLGLARTRARRIGPAEAMRRWKSDRFVRPAAIDPGRRSSVDQVHLASCQRVLRAQRFVEPEAFAHFVLFALVSSARDSGTARTEAQLLIMHLNFWEEALDDLLGSTWGRFAYTLIDNKSIGHRLVDAIQSEMPDAPLTEYPERTQGIGYYQTAAFKIMARTKTNELEIGDGGFVGWTAELIPDAKESAA